MNRALFFLCAAVVTISALGDGQACANGAECVDNEDATSLLQHKTLVASGSQRGAGKKQDLRAKDAEEGEHASEASSEDKSRVLEVSTDILHSKFLKDLYERSERKLNSIK